VAHACNPSYLGGRDQEDQGSKPVQRIVRETVSCVSKNPITKRAGGVAQVKALSSNPSTAKTKQNNKTPYAVFF
jgi:hypothetical protein